VGFGVKEYFFSYQVYSPELALFKDNKSVERYIKPEPLPGRGNTPACLPPIKVTQDQLKIGSTTRPQLLNKLKGLPVKLDF
jgi:hypothetical protein